MIKELTEPVAQVVLEELWPALLYNTASVQ